MKQTFDKIIWPNSCPVTLKEWVDALRSGDYKQGKGRFYNSKEKKYCCLGVLWEMDCCKLPAGNERTHAYYDLLTLPLTDKWHHMFINTPVLQVSEREYRIAMPEQCTAKLDEQHIIDHLYTNKHDIHEIDAICMSMNDDWGFTFDLIADFIEHVFEQETEDKPAET